MLSGVEKVQLDSNNPNPDAKVIIIHQQAVMECALNILSDLVRYKTVILKARGESIPTAVSVANVLTENMLKGNSKIVDISVDSENFDGKYGSTLISTIGITITKTN